MDLKSCLTDYTPGHRRELEQLLDSESWRRTLSSGLLEEVKAERIAPGTTRPFIDTVVDQLLGFTKPRVQELIDEGVRDEAYLFDELSRWPEHLEGKDSRISFLGFNVTADCNFDPKCIYCNQPYTSSSVNLDGWKRIIADATSTKDKAGPYIYLTGGEPLVLEKQIWGDDGLVRYATERGAVVNVNTNALALTPEVALRFIKSGLARLHISLDTPNETMQNILFRGKRLHKVLEGIYNVQIARDIVGVSYPEIHTNCVLTVLNLDFPELFKFILEKRKQYPDRNHALFNDLFPHVIPVGGKNNDYLRPTKEQFKEFYEKTWPEVCRIWDAYQEKLGVPTDKRRALFGYFSNPFLRVEHGGGLEGYVESSSKGVYSADALSQHCYVAPTQASFTPDGKQYRCGWHAIMHFLPIGDIAEKGLFDNISGL